MIGLKESFGTVSLDQWLNRLKKDLKSEDLHELIHFDAIEDIQFQSHYHNDLVRFEPQNPGDFPYKRSVKTSSNKWGNACAIQVVSESQANKKALDILMNGVDTLFFELNDKEVDLNVLLNGIGLEHIHTNFSIKNLAQFHEIVNGPGKTFNKNISINLDLLSNSDYSKQLPELAQLLKDKQFPFLLVDGYSLQQCGANITQELAFMISKGHEYLFRLMNEGLTIDEAAACIHFRVGIGSNYFCEIAKFRALRELWSQIVVQYNPLHTCSYTCKITAKTGLMNKSAKDPHTNLLRQTTEAMSAISGGCDIVQITPYDEQTADGTSTLAERMAINISLILKEESYMDIVIDPAGGSYTVEQLTEIFAKKAWEKFQAIEKNGGIFQGNILQMVLDEVKSLGLKRLEGIRNKEKTLIGINKYPNSEIIQNAMLPASKYLDLNFINFERDI